MNNTEIRELRKRLGWTQEKLGDYIGVHNSTISRWENGKRKPRKKSAYELGDLEWYYERTYAFNPKPSLLTRIKDWLSKWL